MNYNLKIPSDVQYILDVLYENGYEGYMVGGCVRDLILGRKPNDYDITTNAQPDVVASIFEKVILTGLKHGTVTVVINDEMYEVTTYRKDGKYEDNRHPKEVQFVTDIKEDLSRRDFTINSMAYNDEKGLIDFFGGVSDLKNKIIRTVGEPEKRFEEDALRMLRAVRFAVQLDFKIDENVFKSIEILSGNIKNISKERIREEFNKIILKNPKGIDMLNNCGILDYIIEGYGKLKNYKYKNKSIYECCLSCADKVDSEIYLRIAVILNCMNLIDEYTCEKENLIEKEIYNNSIKSETSDKAEDILRILKYDKNTIKKVKTLIMYYNIKLEDKIDIKKALNIMGKILVEDLIKIRYVYAEYICDEKEKSKLIEVQKMYNEIILNNECFSIQQMDINGKDLIKIGIINGKNIGIMLNYLLDKIIKNNNLNSREKIIEMAKLKMKRDIF